MEIRRICAQVGLALVAIVAVASTDGRLGKQDPIRTENQKRNRSYLKNLTSIALCIDGSPTASEAMRRGQNAIELHMKSAGLKPFIGNYLDVPTLMITVWPALSEAGPGEGWHWTIKALLYEPVTIARNGVQLRTESWTYWFYDPMEGLDGKPLADKQGNSIILPTDKSKPKKLEQLDALLDAIGVEFVNDFLAANPKK